MLRQQNRKLVAAETRHGVAFAHTARQSLGDRLQHSIACGVAERVVDGFEAIEIEQEHGLHLIVAAGHRDRLFQTIFEEHLVGQVGQRVVIGEVI